MARYCVAQFVSRRTEPTIEKPFLFRKLEFLLSNKVAHAVAEAGDVVLGLGGFGAPREAERGELGAQGGERGLVRKPDGVRRGVKGDRRFAGADEDAFVFVAQRLDVRARRRARELAPSRGESAGFFDLFGR